AADLDGSGLPTLAVAVEEGAGGRVLLFRAGGAPAGSIALPRPPGAGPSLPDLDGDGKRWVVVGDKGGALHVLRPDGAPRAGFPAQLGAKGDGVTSAAAFGELGKA